MAIFTRINLLNVYTWTTVSGDNPKLKGEPDSSLLSRKEGYEVLYMIQKLMEKWDLKNISSGQKIEKMIHAAPSNLHSQEHVKDWISKNWDRY